ncbi:MAG: MDR family MFS transporter [Ktedonobacterales bacterium]
MEMPPPLPTRNTGAPSDEDGVRLRGWALASVLTALMLTLLLAALDQTIVSTALPTIVRELNGLDRITWVVTAYLLTSTTMVPIVGKLSDQFGRKWFVITGVVIFLVGSALSGAANSMNQLIFFRGLQGIGAGMLQAMIFTLIGDIFTPVERARWQGLFTGVFALASVVGPTLGGWITDNSTWRWIFYVNLPIGVVALAALVFWLPANISLRSTRFRGWAAVRRIDFAGALTAAAATTCLLLGLTWGGQDYPWSSPQVIGTLVAAGALYLAFAFVERHAVEPILPLDMFRNQVFAAGSVLALGVGAALFAVIFYLPLFIQGVLGQSATNSGAAITPLTVTMAIGAVAGGFTVARVGRYQWLAILGSIVLVGGIYLLAQMGVHTNILTVTRNMIVVGVGLGMLQPVLTLAVQNAIPRTRLGVGTGAVTYLRSLGSTLGLAVIGAVESNTGAQQLQHLLPANASQLPAKLRDFNQLAQLLTSADIRAQVIAQVARATAQRLAPSGPAHAAAAQQITTQVTALLDHVFAAARESLAIGIQHAFYVGLGIAVAIVVTTFFLKDVPLRGRVEPATPALAGTTAGRPSAADVGAREPEPSAVDEGEPVAS